MKNARVLLYFIFLFPFLAVGQEKKPAKVFLNGYLKQMGTITFANDQVTYDNLVHNRLNFKWLPNQDWTIKVEARNRLLNGYTVQNLPEYSKILDLSNDYFDLSWTPIDTEQTILHLMVDRANIKYFKEQLEVTVGRQRINWGKTLVWNPNDLFNTYSFYDFDYEEMPGSDAIRVSYYWGISSALDFAVKMAEDWDGFVGAVNHQLNIKTYDVQFLAGYHKRDLALGTGWAGYIGQGGFKGEATYFLPVYEKEKSYSAFLCTMSYDYSFKSSFYLNVSAIYNSAGSANPGFGIIGDAIAPELSPKTVTSYNWSTFVQGSYQFHPLVFGGFSTIYQPQDNSLFIGPMVTVSAKQNFDLDLVNQLFIGKQNESYQPLYNAWFIRAKWSF